MSELSWRGILEKKNWWGEEMLFTRGVDYALRGMAYLAKQPEDRLVMASEIASAENMPDHFFSKIFQNLAKSGLINSFRGSNGGFALARSPEAITIRDVIEAVEGPVTVCKCVDAPEVCERNDMCPFRIVFGEAQAAVVTVLAKYSLADAVSQMETFENQA